MHSKLQYKMFENQDCMTKINEQEIEIKIKEDKKI